MKTPHVHATIIKACSASFGGVDFSTSLIDVKLAF